MADYDNIFDEILAGVNACIERAAERHYEVDELVIYMTQDYMMRLRLATDKYKHRGHIDGVESVMGYKIFTLFHVFDEEHPDFRVVEI